MSKKKLHKKECIQFIVSYKEEKVIHQKLEIFKDYREMKLHCSFQIQIFWLKKIGLISTIYSKKTENFCPLSTFVESFSGKFNIWEVCSALTI